MSLCRRQKEDLLARVRLQSYPFEEYHAYGHSDVSVILMGEPRNNRAACAFEDKVVEALRPELVIHYLHGTDEGTVESAERAQLFCRLWTQKYEIPIIPINKEVNEEKESPPWIEHRIQREEWIRTGRQKDVCLVQTIENAYRDAHGLVVAILPQRQLEQDSLARRMLRDEDGDGNRGDGISFIAINLKNEPRPL